MVSSLGACYSSFLLVSRRRNSSVLVGSPSQPLRILARGFASSAPITFNGLSHVTTFVKSQKLSVFSRRQISLLT